MLTGLLDTGRLIPLSIESPILTPLTSPDSDNCSMEYNLLVPNGALTTVEQPAYIITHQTDNSMNCGVVNGGKRSEAMRREVLGLEWRSSERTCDNGGSS